MITLSRGMLCPLLLAGAVLLVSCSPEETKQPEITTQASSSSVLQSSSKSATQQIKAPTKPAATTPKMEASSAPSVTDIYSNEDDATEQQIVAIEAQCREQKKGHIVQCGMGFPEDDYECRTTKAEQAYRECVASMILKDMLGEDYGDTYKESSMDQNSSY